MSDVGHNPALEGGRLLVETVGHWFIALSLQALESSLYAVALFFLVFSAIAHVLEDNVQVLVSRVISNYSVRYDFV